MLWVIKIGGSLYNSHYLLDWLTAISECENYNFVVVPGGGPFADQIRHADSKYKLDQALVHNMAVLSMQQYAYVMKSLCPELKLVNSKDQIQKCMADKKSAIWEPFDMVSKNCDLEKTWDTTSDSIAGWLAKFINADQLLFIKSSDITLRDKTINELLYAKCIDSNLQSILSGMDIKATFLHKSHVYKFKQLVDS